jgi:hypothetical protein
MHYRLSRRWSKLRLQRSPLCRYDVWALIIDLCAATTSALIGSPFRVAVARSTALIAFLASVVLCANATAASTQYAVDGLAVGTKLDFNSASYRDYKCSPSNQFDGLTWCQKARTDRKGRASSAGYSILHSRERDVLYVNRSQEPASFNATLAEDEIQRLSRTIGESARIQKMPHRSGLPDGLVAVWGEITLEQLDRESIKILAEGKGPKKGLLIDFLGDFVRSAKEGLPIYRIGGGPGLIFGASFGRKGGGTLRLAAVDTSGFRSPTLRAEQPATPLTADKAETETNQAELGQTVEELKTEILLGTTKIAELEKATATAEAARTKAAKASVDVESAKREIEQASTTAKAKLEATMARLEAEGAAAMARLEAERAAAADARASRWENTLPGAIGGMFVLLASSIVGFFADRGKTIASKLGTNQIDVSAQHQNSESEIVPYAGSLTIAGAKVAFERELEQQVAAINAPRDELTDPSNRRFNGAQGLPLALPSSSLS